MRETILKHVLENESNHREHVLEHGNDHLEDESDHLEHESVHLEHESDHPGLVLVNLSQGVSSRPTKIREHKRWVILINWVSSTQGFFSHWGVFYRGFLLSTGCLL